MFSKCLDCHSLPLVTEALRGAGARLLDPDGKPIMDGEMYAGGSRAGFRNPYVRQFIRGFNASYIFKWCKRSLDWRNRSCSLACWMRASAGCTTAQ